MSEIAETVTANAQCLCGAVSMTAKAVSPQVGACHCSICRNWGGGPMMAVDCQTDVVWDGEEHIRVFNSSAWAERAFCDVCGSHLFYRLKESGKTIVPVGLFKTEIPFDFNHQVFIDEKPEFYAFANTTHDMTGAECFAAFAEGCDA